MGSGDKILDVGVWELDFGFWGLESRVSTSGFRFSVFGSRVGYMIEISGYLDILMIEISGYLDHKKTPTPLATP